MYPFFDSTMILVLPAFAFAMWAQFKVKSTFTKYSQEKAYYGYAGHELARNLLDRAGLGNVVVESVPGELSDHYDPRDRVLRLSDSTYYSNSVAAYGVVAHEVGHAVQHAKSYMLLNLRNSFVPVANIGSMAAMPLFMIGLFINHGFMMDLGIIFYSAAVFFHMVTLPVELDASNRAIALLEGNSFLYKEELPKARKVLNAAAMTYLASMAVALTELLRLLILRNSRDD